MLVLSRKESQRIKLGDSIVVTVVRVTGDKVRLGIEAPADILVLRGELEPTHPPGAQPPSDRPVLETVVPSNGNLDIPLRRPA
jgi:carbon storage regulator